MYITNQPTNTLYVNCRFNIKYFNFIDLYNFIQIENIIAKEIKYKFKMQLKFTGHKSYNICFMIRKHIKAVDT